MVNAHKKGREAENRASTWFTVHGYPNELVRLQGINDAGDIWLPYEHSRLQVKNHVALLSAIADGVRYLDDLKGRHPRDECLVVAARPGMPVNKWYVVQTVEQRWPPRAPDVS